MNSNQVDIHSLDKLWHSLLSYSYMSTINISLPSNQVDLIDQFVRRYGFANRSEFVRALVRLITQKPEIVENASVYPFISPKTKSTLSIISDFKKTKKYSTSFLKDLEDGLR